MQTYVNKHTKNTKKTKNSIVVIAELSYLLKQLQYKCCTVLKNK